MSKVTALVCSGIRIVGETVTISHPHRLFSQFVRRLQIIGMKFLGNDVIIRLEWRGFLFYWRIVLAPLVKNVASSYGGNSNARGKGQLNFLLVSGLMAVPYRLGKIKRET